MGGSDAIQKRTTKLEGRLRIYVRGCNCGPVGDFELSTGPGPGWSYKSGENEILAYRLNYFPSPFHSRFDHEHITRLQVLGLFTFRSDDAIAIEEG